jgi:hypothetical protein
VRRGAPYVHPRLSVIDVGNCDGGPLIVEIVKFARHDEPGEKQLWHVPAWALRSPHIDSRGALPDPALGR